MFHHYLSTALRHFRRFRFATTVNIVSLSLGLACLVVTYAVLTFLSKSDAHFENADRIQVVSVDLDAPAVNARFENMPLTGPVVASLVEAEFPHLEGVARRTPEQPVAVSTGDSATFASVSYGDARLLDLFDLPFVAGAGNAALRSPHSAVITERGAERIFGTSNVVGRRLLLANREEVSITGVIHAIRQPTRFTFELLVSMDVLDALQLARGMQAPTPGELGDWWWLGRSYITYALLPSDTAIDRATFGEQLRAFSVRSAPKHGSGNTLQLGVMPLSKCSSTR